MIYRALRVAGGSARYARSEGRMERKDRESNILGANRRLANSKRSVSNPGAVKQDAQYLLHQLTRKRKHSTAQHSTAAQLAASAALRCRAGLN